MSNQYIDSLHATNIDFLINMSFTIINIGTHIPETHHWSFWYTHDYKKQEREGLIWCYNLSQRLLMDNIISHFVEDESLKFNHPYQSKLS